MNKKIKLFDVDRTHLVKTEAEVNGFMESKEVTKVFLSPGYPFGQYESHSPIILVVYEE